jgi:hypothetical protein
MYNQIKYLNIEIQIKIKIWYLFSQLPKQKNPHKRVLALINKKYLIQLSA